MFESKNKTINLSFGNSNSASAIPNKSISIKDSLQIMNNPKGISKKISKKKAIELFEEYNEKYLTKNPKEESKYKSIIEENNSYTPEDKQEIYWKELKIILGTIQQTPIEYSAPILPFGKSMNDLDFPDLVKQAINYACHSQNKENLNYMNDVFNNIEEYTQNIFIFPNVLKDVKKDGLLSFIVGETFKEKKEGLCLLKASYSTITPLLKLKFENNGINYDLDKEEIYKILTSKVVLKFYRDNLKDFIPNFQQKVKDDESLKAYMKLYLNNYNIYFCDLPSNLMAVTIYNGNIYLKSIYLQEYFTNINKDIINQDDSIIIREKIVLNLKHEFNHGLIRIIDKEKNSNFFLKSKKSNKTNDYIVFREKLNENIFHNYPVDESGNCFDFKLYRGYYFNNLYKNEAHFFLEIQSLKDENDYIKKFDEMMNNKGNDFYTLNSINKFKIIDDEHPHCFKIALLGANLYH